jgi:hypothetical protein
MNRPTPIIPAPQTVDVRAGGGIFRRPTILSRSSEQHISRNMTIRSRRAVALLALGLAACTDGGTGSEPTLGMTLVANASEPTITTGSTGAPQSIACDLSFHARAGVNGDASAQWGAGKMRFYAGAAGSAPLDSLTLSATDVARSFGNDVITGGQAQVSSWRVSAGGPFRVEGSFTYRVRGASQDRSISATAVCAPGGTLAAGPAPAVVNIAISGPTDPEPGDTLTISWTAGSEQGLWETGVLVRGAWEAESAVAGRGARTLTPSVQVIVPQGAALGQPVQLVVFAVDVNLQLTATPVQRGVVVDRTPPRIVRLSTISLANHEISLGGQYASGQPVTLWAMAQDNRGGGWLVMESGGTLRDSVAFQPNQLVSLPVPHAWVDGRELRVYARDVLGNTSAPIVAPAGAFHFYPDVPVQVGTATVQQGGSHGVLSPDGGYLYLSQLMLQRVDVVDLSTMAVTSIPMPAPAGPLDVTPDGRRLVVSLSHSQQLGIVDLATGAVQVVPLSAPGLTMLGDVAVAANGKVLLHGHTGISMVLFEHDLATGTTRVRNDVPAQALLSGIGRSLDHGRLLVGAGCVYSSATDSFGPCAEMSAPGTGFQGDLTGRRWNIQSVIYDQALNRVNLPRDDAFDSFSPATLAPSGTELLVGAGGGLLRVRISDGLVVNRYTSPFPEHGTIFVSRDGSRIVTLTNGRVVRMQLP